MIRYTMDRLLVAGVLLGAVLACEPTGPEPEPVVVDPAFDEAGGIAWVTFGGPISVLREFGLVRAPECFPGDDMGWGPEAAPEYLEYAYWVPAGVAQRVADLSWVKNLQPAYGPPYDAVNAPAPLAADTAQMGPLRVTLSWNECDWEGNCALAIPEYRVLNTCYYGADESQRALGFSLENTSDSTVVIEYAAGGRFTHEGTDRWVSATESHPFEDPNLMLWELWGMGSGTVAPDTLAAGEAAGFFVPWSIARGEFGLPAPAGTYRIRMALNTVGGPTVAVSVRLSAPPGADGP